MDSLEDISRKIIIIVGIIMCIFGSFGNILNIYVFTKWSYHRRLVNTNQTNNNTVEYINLGHMLISFLELYGVYFNYAKLGIRVQTPYQPDRPAGFIDKEELFKNFCCGHRTISNLCIVDPFNDSMLK